ncbi:MAG: transcription antitermination factor NusB [Candidatus Gastranaerophilaceae bacterium]|jgi:transcription antitermination factor nusB|uniref:Transcription antitermination protein NusB n=1 Tax=Candidatus Limenecus avicola TaxID=2840847 RepID=A0A9D1N220_9CLOT|nr:n utilization substance protein B homolog [Clostridium sp. CAG:306]HIU93337.1 transcription antitermination factor NusB [Candidatus Limenecus avicola]
MQARRAARELALILFSQFDKKITQYNQTEFEDIILKSVRTLTNNAIDELKVSVGAINAMKEYVDTYEAESPENLKRPMHANNVPVPLPMTSDLSGRLEELLNISEKVVLALEIAEMTALEHTGDVKSYVVQIATAYKEHAQEIDSLIQKYAHGWDLDRLVKIDKDILRIAIAELLFIEGVPVKVVVDEALELAKKYSTDDSSSFINGILGKVIDEKKDQ